MNATELAKAMLEYQELHAKLQALGAQIESAVMDIGATQTVGSLSAKFSEGRKTYDYETAVVEAGFIADEDIAAFTTEKITKNIDWRAICKTHNVESIPFTQSEPRVSLVIT